MLLMILMTFKDFSLISMIFKRKLEEQRAKKLKEEKAQREAEEKKQQEEGGAETEKQPAEEQRGTTEAS